jgi:hypothetical protein
MPSRLVDLLLQALSLAEQFEEQTEPNAISFAAFQHALQDAAVEAESIWRQSPHFSSTPFGGNDRWRNTDWVQPHRPLIDVLRGVLRKIDAIPGPDTPDISALKAILRQRIAKIEGSL